MAFMALSRFFRILFSYFLSIRSPGHQHKANLIVIGVFPVVYSGTVLSQAKRFMIHR